MQRPFTEDDITAVNVHKLLDPPSSLIFLSYAKEDRERVKAIHKRLRTEHLNPWLDIADLMPGQQWDQVIIRTIRNARFVIVFLSNHSVNKRGYVQKEIKEALDVAETVPDGQMFIIPVRLEPCVVPERLAKWQWIDIFQRNALKKIVRTLKENLDPEASYYSKSKAEARLVVMNHKNPEALFQLEKTVSMIGRSSSRSRAIPEINLSRFDPNRKVSREHALIFRFGNAFVIKDCGSTNGTIINDNIILKSNQSRLLKFGDKLCFGDTTLLFVGGHP